MKNLIINSEKIIWARIVEPYPSKNWKWFDEYTPSWIDRKIFREKIEPAGFYRHGDLITEKELNRKYFIVEKELSAVHSDACKILMCKPHININIAETPDIYELWCDTMEEAESKFSAIKLTLPDYILCE